MVHASATRRVDFPSRAAEVLRQPDGIAWTVFDGRIAAIARQFEDFRQAEAAGAILESTRLAVAGRAH